MKTMYLKITILLCILASITNFVYSQPGLEKEFDSIILPYVENHMFSGTVLVSKNGKVIYKKGFGKANMEWTQANEPDSKFIIGSISKSFTATLVMRLVQDQKIRLSDTIDQYLPNFPKDKSGIITIHHLLSNTSGLPNYFSLPGWTKGVYNRQMSKSEFMGELAKLELAFEPGERYMYSNAGYFLLGLIIEKVTSLTFPEAMQKYIFEPADMKNSGVYRNTEILLNKAYGYRFSEKGGYRSQSFMNMVLFEAAGNLYSTVEDLYKFDQVLYTEQILNTESKEALFDSEYEYGWTSDSLDIAGLLDSKQYTLGYNGQINGHSALLTRFTNDNHLIVVMSNTGTGYWNKRQLTSDLASVLFDVTLAEEKPRLSLFLTRLMYEGKLVETIDHFQLNETDYSINELLISDVGQQLSWSGLMDQAIKVYELNAKIFSDSPNANFQLAEAYKESDQLTKAIPFYKKVLKVYPDNTYIVHFL